MEPQGLAGLVQRADGLIARHGGEIGQKIVEAIASLQVVKESLNRDPGASEHWSSAQNPRVGGDDRCVRFHGGNSVGIIPRPIVTFTCGNARRKPRRRNDAVHRSNHHAAPPSASCR